MSDFNDDLAIITGGTKGIGRAVAERFADQGATTIATYHSDEEAATDTEQALRRYDAPTAVRCFDVREYDAVTQAFETIADEFGAPSILVNNAGIMRNTLLLRMDVEEWQSVIDTNLTGAFHCTKQAVRFMLRRDGGRIINVSSIAGQRGWAGQANYAASKAGLIGFTRAVARELGGKSIRVNAVAPGYTDTELAAEVNPSEQKRENVKEQIPQNRFATPSEVADAILYLASSDAAYVTGEVLRVDGGLLG